MFNFLIDWKRFINDFLPPLKRRQRFKDWMDAMLSQARELNKQFAELAAQIRYDMQFDGTVISLETLLNEAFATTGIYISDANANSKKVYIYTEPENMPLVVYTMAEYEADPNLPRIYLHTYGEYQAGNSFVVNVPVSLVFDENRMRALIDKYRAAGKTYTIVKY